MKLLKKYLWLICMFVAILGLAFVWFCLPHQSKIEQGWWLVVKFAVFVFAVLGISFFPNKFKWNYLACCLPFFAFLCLIIPRASYYGIFGTLNTPAQGEMYTNLYLLCYPLIIMSVAFAHRLSGGTPGHSIKICLIGITMIFSGILDLCFNTANGHGLANSLDYAYHIIVIFGHPLTWTQGLIFCLCHIPLYALYIWLPLDKWFGRLGLIEVEPVKQLKQEEQPNPADPADPVKVHD
jgi:hypothetical protein